MIDSADGISFGELADSGVPAALLLEELPEPEAAPKPDPPAGASAAPCAVPAAGSAATPGADEDAELDPLPEQPASPQPQMMVPAIVPAMSTRARCVRRRRCLSK